MAKEQKSLFDTRRYKGEQPQTFDIKPPTAGQTVFASLPAYHAYLSTSGYAVTTPKDFTADIKRFGQFTGSKPIGEIMDVDIRQWITQLKPSMEPKTLSRKISAIGNYFKWLKKEKVIDENPAIGIFAPRLQAPLPDVLFENECQQLLKSASSDPRTYLLVLLLLETGIKKAELQELRVKDFDLSNKYQPELWIKHTGKHVFKDRRVKLPIEAVAVFTDYIEQYNVTDVLFPYTPKHIENLLSEAGRQAQINKSVTASILRDMFVVRSVKQGMRMEEAFEKIGLSKSSYDDARKKYGRLTREAL
jgi:integrase/recombinase XerD